ncbi:relaxase/mobilization nuclease domain-containing protein [Bifidobacterium sp. SO4]|uniref:relaxase/mobilization nuclease domain-containing protein n=1 Tax=Bifidobacterium sp. SO4 TaxID=2809030 RepID=UPI001BDCCD41|nr:relaxase/mobilization nuclease domain-containing protein [Bifidobacterium sp. SO4]MBT1170689.1 relaxase/mobilization nuclease domain-containing protein [Bifidobacterium sp. SO4]
MAVVKVGQIKTTLHLSIAYIINPDKTEEGTLVTANYSDMVSDPAALAEAMLESLDRTAAGRRAGGVLAHHVIQSFSPDDSRRMTAQQVHEIGIAFVEEITGGGHQYVIATHVDRDHTHNHIIICAANTETRRKLRVQRGTLGAWREVSDRLCRERGLEVLPRRDRSRTREGLGTERHGFGLGELYASAKGDAVKDRIRLAVDAAAASSVDFDSFAAAMRRNGVRVDVRGRHLTFTDVASGLKVRDVRLGRAYDEPNIMARIGRGTVTPISFNRRMIAASDDGMMRVWLPGTRRGLALTVPVVAIVRDGDTYRAYLPTASPCVITDRRGRYVRRITPEGLYEFFSRPPVRLEPATRESRLTPGKSEAQRNWYRLQARKLDQLHDLADELNTATRLTRDDVSVDDAIRDVTNRIASEREAFQALLVALDESTDAEPVDGNRSGELARELRDRERRLDRLSNELKTLRRLRLRVRQPEPVPSHRTP